MIWLQEYGNKTGANRIDYRLYYCDSSSDVNYAPTLTSKGDSAYFVEPSESDLEPCKVGDQILIWGTGDLKTLMPDNKWKSVGE